MAFVPASAIDACFAQRSFSERGSEVGLCVLCG